MGFGEAIRTFYSRYTDFEGRSRRSEYWWMQLLLLIVAVVLGGIAGATGTFSETGDVSVLGTIALLILGLFFLGHIIGLIALQVRRFHNLGQTGWLVLVFAIVGMIPVIGTLTGIAQIVWFCFPGNKGPNKYGPDPLDPHFSSVFD